MAERITSRRNKRILDVLGKASDGHFLLEGFHLVEEGLNAGAIEEIYSLKPYDAGKVPVYLVAEEVMEKLSSLKNGEGIIALGKRKDPSPFSSGKCLYLDRVQDPANVGAILRSALAFGYKDILLSKGCADPYKPKALMASQGSIFSLNIRMGKDDFLDDLEFLKEEGYSLIGTSLKDAEFLGEAKIPEGRICLILGNEGQGVKEEILERTSLNLKIRISGIDSLNVAVAAGILMHGLS